MNKNSTLHTSHKQSCCDEDTAHPPHEHAHNHNHDGGTKSIFIRALLSFVILAIALFFDHYLHPMWFDGWRRVLWYVAAYLPVGFPVLKEALESIKHGDVFSEFFLMGIATIGAFAIAQYPEAVAVMLFYYLGEGFQTMAIARGKKSIQTLLDQRPDEVTILEGEQPITKAAQKVEIGNIILLKPGEKLALDGVLISERAAFDTASLTGESLPVVKTNGEQVLAGMVNQNSSAQVEVTQRYQDSKLSKIIELISDAAKQKAPTELFIRRFARIYTPIVVALAIAITIMPYFFLPDYQFSNWLYRALVFLVISCPCALVISIPLGYFGGIGAGSRHGILFKGSNYLDILAQIDHVVLDKTGTLTQGRFKVQEIFIKPEFDREDTLKLINVLESHSTHPVATAIHEYVGKPDATIKFENVEEIPGHGLRAFFNGKEILVGNFKLLHKFKISYNSELENLEGTVITIAIAGKYAGCLTIFDKIKPDAATAILQLQKMNIGVSMLSGDRDSVVQRVAKTLKIPDAYGGLLPEDKINKTQAIKDQKGRVAFVGDGFNDAPVLALSDVGLAMGGLGSDAAIESADVVIQDDKPSKIPIAIKIGKKTKQIVWQNITLAFLVKAAVLLLGAGGIATMWEAVFADVGVALLAILNALRIQYTHFKAKP